MPQNNERGRFFIGPNGYPRFAGSSSGVYLADTIRTQLSEESIGQQAIESEIEQAFIARNIGRTLTGTETSLADDVLRVSDLLSASELRVCITRYFARWHPLFPFLDGAHLIQCFDNAVNMAKVDRELQGMDSDGTAAESQPAFSGLSSEDALILSATFLSIFALGSLDNSSTSDNLLPNTCLPRRLRSASHATKLAHQIIEIMQTARVNDLFGLQSLLAIQLYLYASRALRPAMHMSGILTKLAYEAGLHRCPDRYRKVFTSNSTRQLRKRVFYSLYALDRILSAEFGIPIMMHDSDIDTCLPGESERHCDDAVPDALKFSEWNFDPVAGDKRKRVDDMYASLSGPVSSSTVRPTPPPTSNGEIEPAAAQNRLLAADALTKMATMIGRAMEGFNKCLKSRTLDANDGLILRADADRWWNDVGMDSEEDITIADPRRRYPTLLHCLYHQQIINLNRPALSLEPNETHHACALQSSIASTRTILSLLSKSSDQDDLFWPGYVDMVFFSCLLLVYGFRRDIQNSNSRTRLHADLKRALSILEVLHRRWNNLAGFVKVVRTFIRRIDPADEGTFQQGDQTDMSTLDLLRDDFAFADPTGSDFFFDFSSFELNPDSTWAYHASVPGSPIA